MKRIESLIGITTYAANENHEVTLPVNYIESVRRAGGIPVLLPPGESRSNRYSRISVVSFLPAEATSHRNAMEANRIHWFTWWTKVATGWSYRWHAR